MPQCQKCLGLLNKLSITISKRQNSIKGLRCSNNYALATTFPRCTCLRALYDLFFSEKVASAHILHLIYIALHPVKDIQLNATGLEEEEIYDPKILVMSSPRKLVKQTKSRRVLSAVAVVAAQKLLSAFVRTNPPVSLAAALPFYPDVTLDTLFELELVDSVIFLQVKALRDNSKSCWDLVKTGALEQAKRAYPTSVKTKGRAQPSRGTHDYSTVDGAESEEVKPVGDNSWFLLGWLLDLFEKDSDERALKSQRKCC